MAGYVIHLAVAEEYIRKHPQEIDNYDEFIEGVISPDGVQDKSQTHYGEESGKVNLKKFFDERDIKDSFNKGYFLHLVTDYIFYNKLLDCYSKDIIYNDYDILNKTIITKYNVKIPEKVKKFAGYAEGKTKILHLEDVIEFIDKVSSFILENIKSGVLDEDEYWCTYRVLKKI